MIENPTSTDLPSAALRGVLPVALTIALLALAIPRSAPAQEADGEEAQTPAVLTGQVVSGMTGGPLENARVVLQSSGLGAITDSAGSFVIADIPPGRETIEVSLIGFAEEEVSLDLRAGTTTEVTFLLSETILRVEEITVTVERERTGKLMGFERRSRQGLGHFLSPEEIADMNPQYTSDLVRSVPGVSVGAARMGGAEVRITRGSRNCSPAIFLDGIHQRGMELDDLNRDDVMAIEVYRGPSETPPQFATQGTSCGIMVVWTQDGRRISSE